MPKVNLGGLEPLRSWWPGIGGRNNGTADGAAEDDDMARLLCLSPGKNNSLGSAVVARSAVLLADTLTGMCNSQLVSQSRG